MSRFGEQRTKCLGDCANCPTAKDLARILEAKRRMAEAVAPRLVGEELDEATTEFFGEFSDLEASEGDATENSPLTIPVPAAGGFRLATNGEELAQALRKSMAEGMEQLDSDEAHFEGFLAKCSGPLVMRAVKDGREVTVRVCMNPEMPDGILPTDPTEVIRRTLPEQ